MTIRKTVEADLPQIGEIYENAKRFMHLNGNPYQWNKDEPNKETARKDMERGEGYVAEEDGRIQAVFMFKIGDDPTYHTIEGGAWLSDAPYAVIHRIAVATQGRGIIGACIDACFTMHPNIRIDTHKDNLPMQKALTKRGFTYCGIIYLENGEKRWAYQKIK